ncbi:hypothetical protein COLO4_22816 [Corchorus olitorius]|uniref:Uncharacterized protein n=1 Tax=Corchorus olitorius TaxID=93759 RepID=A0A1R3IJS0_9ROSI|nr:hypothetical protein COLO4_22816 [Corchorus olitorius]
MASASPDQVSPPTSLVHPPRMPPAVPPSRPEGHLQPPSPTAVESNSQAASHPSSAIEDNDGAATSRTRTRLTIDEFRLRFIGISLKMQGCGLPSTQVLDLCIEDCLVLCLA